MNLFVSLIAERLRRCDFQAIVIVQWPLRYHSATTMASGAGQILLDNRMQFIRFPHDHVRIYVSLGITKDNSPIIPG